MATTDDRPLVRHRDWETRRLGDKRTGVFSGLLVSWSPCLLVRATRLLFVVLLLALAACGAAPGDAVSQADLAGGSRFGPESVAENFFKDLRDALKDPALADDAGRSKWAEKLANYFAPNERDDQRVALRDALDSFVQGLGRLDSSERLTLEVRFDNFQKVSETDDRALIRPINGSIYVLISRTTNSGVVTIYEDSVGFDKILGREDGAVPVVRIGRSWFLTEG